MIDARPYAILPDPRSRSRSGITDSHSRGVDRESRTGLNFDIVHLRDDDDDDGRGG